MSVKGYLVNADGDNLGYIEVTDSTVNWSFSGTEASVTAYLEHVDDRDYYVVHPEIEEVSNEPLSNREYYEKLVHRLKSFDSIWTVVEEV